MSNKNEVKAPPGEEKKDAPLPVVQPSRAMVDYGDDAGSGFENQTQEDSTLPFITVLQPGSDEVNGEKPIAKAGEIINRVTGEVWDKETGVLYIPVYTDHFYIERTPTKDSQGNQLKPRFVARHELDSQFVKMARDANPFATFRLPNGNDLVEAFDVVSLVVNEELSSGAPALFRFSSTHIKAYKNLNYVAKAIMVAKPGGGIQNPPLFSHVYRLTTKYKVDGQNKWYIPEITFQKKDASGHPDAEGSRLVPGDMLYEMAKALKKAFLGGEVKVNQDLGVKVAEGQVNAAESGKAPF